MLARLVWTILRALGSQGARQPHLGGTHNHRREAPGKWYHFRQSKGGSKSAFNSIKDHNVSRRYFSPSTLDAAAEMLATV